MRISIARLLLLDDFDPFIDPIHYRQLIAQLKLHVVKVAVQIRQLLLRLSLPRFNYGHLRRLLLELGLLSSQHLLALLITLLRDDIEDLLSRKRLSLRMTLEVAQLLLDLIIVHLHLSVNPANFVAEGTG